MRTLFLSLVFLLQTLICFSQQEKQSFNFTTPDKKNLSKKILWATQYYVHQLNSIGNIQFVLNDGTATNLYADTCAFCDAALEGTAFIKDSTGNVTILNFSKVGDKEFVNCRKCSKYKNSKLSVENWGKIVWVKSSGYGKGVNNYDLVPYRTIATDKSFIPIGTVIFIPLIRGQKIKLPNGEVVTHDGYFYSGDVGKAIIGNHIDIFTGLETKNPFPNIIFSQKDKTFEAYIITDKNIIAELKKNHTK